MRTNIFSPVPNRTIPQQLSQDRILTNKEVFSREPFYMKKPSPPPSEKFKKYQSANEQVQDQFKITFQNDQPKERETVTFKPNNSQLLQNQKQELQQRISAPTWSNQAVQKPKQEYSPPQGINQPVPRFQTQQHNQFEQHSPSSENHSNQPRVPTQRPYSQYPPYNGVTSQYSGQDQHSQISIQRREPTPPRELINVILESKPDNENQRLLQQQMQQLSLQRKHPLHYGYNPNGDPIQRSNYISPNTNLIQLRPEESHVSDFNNTPPQQELTRLNKYPQIHPGDKVDYEKHYFQMIEWYKQLEQEMDNQQQLNNCQFNYLYGKIVHLDKQLKSTQQQLMQLQQGKEVNYMNESQYADR